MRIEILFLPANRDFSRRDTQLIRSIIQRHARKAARVLPFRQRRLTFTVYPWGRDGINAFTQATDWVRVAINPKQFSSRGKRRAEMIEYLIYIVYHEMHHAARGYVGFLPKGQRHILINSMLSEGLANTFANEQYPSPYVSRVTAYRLSQIRKWLPRLRSIKWRRELLMDSWLVGRQGKPKLLGYKIGTFLVHAAKHRHPKLNAAKLTCTPARELMRYSGVKL